MTSKGVARRLAEVVTISRKARTPQSPPHRVGSRGRSCRSVLFPARRHLASLLPRSRSTHWKLIEIILELGLEQKYPHRRRDTGKGLADWRVTTQPPFLCAIHSVETFQLVALGTGEGDLCVHGDGGVTSQNPSPSGRDDRTAMFRRRHRSARQL